MNECSLLFSEQMYRKLEARYRRVTEEFYDGPPDETSLGSWLDCEAQDVFACWDPSLMPGEVDSQLKEVCVSERTFCLLQGIGVGEGAPFEHVCAGFARLALLGTGGEE